LVNDKLNPGLVIFQETFEGGEIVQEIGLKIKQLLEESLRN
jgi:hypothetical protein